MTKKNEKKRDLPEDSKPIDVIPKELESLLSDIPENKRRAIVKSLKFSLFSGPIPPPQLLEGYNKIVKDGPERIFIMAEKQSSHRMQLEDHTIKEQLKQSQRGQWFGFILALICILGTIFLAYSGYQVIASILGTTTIGSLLTVFVLGKKTQQK